MTIERRKTDSYKAQFAGVKTAVWESVVAFDSLGREIQQIDQKHGYVCLNKRLWHH
jgi:hypothetical protein